MLDALLKTVEEELSTRLIIMGVNPDKNKEIINMAKAIVLIHIRNHSKAQTTQAAKGCFITTTPLQNQPWVQFLITEYKKNLMDRIMLLEKIADSIARFIILFILAQVSHRVNQNPEVLKSIVESNGMFHRFKINAVPVFNFF